MLRPFLLAALLALPAAAQDFSEGSEADQFGASGEEQARFAARVVDILCELTGDCPANCGDGRRQLGLLRAADGALVLPVKNAQPLFTGAAHDLQFYCGKEVEVDGLLIGDPEAIPAKLYQLQKIRVAGGEWAEATRWTEVWNTENPDRAKTEGPWFRKDPKVGPHLESGGWLGLGREYEAAFMKEWFE